MKVLLTGSSGFIGSRVAIALTTAGHTPVLTSRKGEPGTVAVDLTNADSIERALGTVFPDAVIHAAAVRDLALCEREPALARAVNFGATDCIASVCHAFGIHPLVFVSTDQVFDGVAGNYAESAPTNPLNVYGETKARAEEVVLKNGGRVARVALTLGHSKDGNRSPNEHVVNLLRARQPCMLYTNEFRTPIHVDDVASALVELLSLEPPVPILHLGGPDRVNRMELGLGIARAYKLDQSLCTPTTSSTATASANSGGVRRAADTSLDTTLARATLKVPPMPISECVDTLRRTQPSHAL